MKTTNQGSLQISSYAFTHENDNHLFHTLKISELDGPYHNVEKHKRILLYDEANFAPRSSL